MYGKVKFGNSVKVYLTVHFPLHQENNAKDGIFLGLVWNIRTGEKV